MVAARSRENAVGLISLFASARSLARLGDTSDLYLTIPVSSHLTLTLVFSSLGACIRPVDSGVIGSKMRGKEEQMRSWWELTKGLESEQAIEVRDSDWLGGPV